MSGGCCLAEVQRLKEDWMKLEEQVGQGPLGTLPHPPTGTEASLLSHLPPASPR